MQVKWQAKVKCVAGLWLLKIPKPSFTFIHHQKTCNENAIDKFSLADFNYKLSFEIWSDVFEGNDVNIIFNSFLNMPASPNHLLSHIISRIICGLHPILK
jgi:hypothetical protein